MKYKKFSQAFTLIELIVAMAILAVIFTISSITLSNIIPSSSQSNAGDLLINDARVQQTQAMTTNSSYGVHFETNSYTLFKGGMYNPGDSGNFVVTLDPTVTISGTTFSGSQIVFSPGSGDANAGNLTLTNSQTTKNTVININQYGAAY